VEGGGQEVLRLLTLYAFVKLASTRSPVTWFMFLPKNDPNSDTFVFAKSDSSCCGLQHESVVVWGRSQEMSIRCEVGAGVGT
jgi:hypothetical protein